MNTGIQRHVLRKRIERRGLSIVITGADGSGKSTLAEQLVQDLGAANLPSRKLHVYAFYANLLLIPFLLLRNRYIDKSILVLDRSIYDNVAVFAAKGKCTIRPFAITILKSIYPKFDYAFYLYADRDEILRRRPEIDLGWHDRLISAYQQLVRLSGHSVMRSDSELYTRIVATLNDDTYSDGI